MRRKRTELTQTHKEIIMALADNGMRISLVAKQQYMTWTRIHHNLERVREITGKDPRNFYDLVELVQMIKQEAAEAAERSESLR